MGKGYNNYMCKKPFHPGSKQNIKRAWMAEQKTENEKRKQDELKVQYEKEQDLYNNRALISSESKDKLELNFMYEAPPGAKRERQKEDDEPEYKFEWQRKYNAPREDYAKGNADIKDQPFGIPVRNVRCIKCHKWGHINTDKECPLFSQASTSSMPTTSMDPMELMRQMREDGFGLKEHVLGHHLNPKAANQQFLQSDESDPEAEFLKSLSVADKKKLLRKLKKLSKKHKKNKKKRKNSHKSRTNETSDSESESGKKKKKKRDTSSSSSNTSLNDNSKRKKYSEGDKKKRKRDASCSSSSSSSDNNSNRKDNENSTRRKKHRNSSSSSSPSLADEKREKRKSNISSSRNENKKESKPSHSNNHKNSSSKDNKSIKRNKHRDSSSDSFSTEEREKRKSNISSSRNENKKESKPSHSSTHKNLSSKDEKSTKRNIHSDSFSSNERVKRKSNPLSDRPKESKSTSHSNTHKKSSSKDRKSTKRKDRDSSSSSSDSFIDEGERKRRKSNASSRNDGTTEPKQTSYSGTHKKSSSTDGLYIKSKKHRDSSNSCNDSNKNEERQNRNSRSSSRNEKKETKQQEATSDSMTQKKLSSKDMKHTKEATPELRLCKSQDEQAKPQESKSKELDPKNKIDIHFAKASTKDLENNNIVVKSNWKLNYSSSSDSESEDKEIRTVKQKVDTSHKDETKTIKVEEPNLGQTSNIDKNDHPDGFNHSCPQAVIKSNYLPVSVEYIGKIDDRFRDMNRDKRSPSVKHKYHT